jgi:opacity protein-like surface antigen
LGGADDASGDSDNGAPGIAKSGLYISLGGGVGLPQSDVVRLKQPVTAGGFAVAPVTPAEVSFKAGEALLIKAGYRWNTGLRTELELSDRRSKVDQFNGTPAARGDQEIWSAIANVLYDFNQLARVTPYLGAGVGVGVVDWRYVTQMADPVFIGNNAAFQWQGIAGLSMPVLTNTELFAEYHYAGVARTHFQSQPWNPELGVGSQVTDHHDRSSNFFVGVRYTF